MCPPVTTRAQRESVNSSESRSVCPAAGVVGAPAGAAAGVAAEAAEAHTSSAHAAASGVVHERIRGWSPCLGVPRDDGYSKTGRESVRPVYPTNTESRPVVRLNDEHGLALRREPRFALQALIERPRVQPQGCLVVVSERGALD